MNDILTQVVFLKSISAGRNVTGTTGAKSQDFRGTDGQVAAHRALFAPEMDVRNIANLPLSLKRAGLRKALIAPQARTDMLFPPENYGDRLLEIVGARPVLDILRTSVEWQKPDQKAEKSMIVDATFRLRNAILRAHDDAMQKSEDILRRRGWETFDPVRFRKFAGPASEIASESLEFVLHKAGPSQFLDLPIIYLATSKQIIEKTQPAMDVATVEQSLDSLQELASGERAACWR
ncbi:hypothetical protein [Beijerinckia mobilis]|uniref:hypothetical protein n=1 Tax=Beijerinckia mobilis TaxID=231434 RepID=UPI0012EB6B5D|nr:hypothetical protein [Beijerinckia mobilis]